MKNLFKIIFTILFFILQGLLFSQEFSADVVTISDGKVIKSKIFMSKNKSRIEFISNDNNKTIIISRQDKKVLWALLPNNKYMELPIKPEYFVPTKDKHDWEGNVEKKFLDKESLNDIEVERYKITYYVNKQKVSMFVWFNSDGLPLKVTDENIKWQNEYGNIKKEKQPDSLFELPDGCLLVTEEKKK